MDKIAITEKLQRKGIYSLDFSSFDTVKYVLLGNINEINNNGLLRTGPRYPRNFSKGADKWLI